MNPWIQTRDGHAIDLLSPDLSKVSLEEIAWALAHIYRFTGHVGPYSVAQHSVLVKWALQDEGEPPEILRDGLFHDAHEMIVGDVSSPLKRAMRIAGKGESPFDAVEESARLAVVERFGLSRELPESVRVMDLRVLLAESRALFANPPPRSWGLDGIEPAWVNVRPWRPEHAAELFAAEARFLGAM